MNVLFWLFCCFRLQENGSSTNFFQKPRNILDKILNDSLPPVLSLKILSYLCFDGLDLRCMSHEYNYKTSQLYRRVLISEFHPSIGKLPVLIDWHIAGVKFIREMMRIRSELEEKGMICNKKPSYEKPREIKNKFKSKNTFHNKNKFKSNKSKFYICNDETVTETENDHAFHVNDHATNALLRFNEMNLIDLLNLFIKIYRTELEAKPLALLLDFLQFSQIRLPTNQPLIDLLADLRGGKLDVHATFRSGPMAYKIITALGFSNFNDRRIRVLLVSSSECEADWTEFDRQRRQETNPFLQTESSVDSLRSSTSQPSSLSVSWNSRFDDRDDLGRASVSSSSHPPASLRIIDLD